MLIRKIKFVAPSLSIEVEGHQGVPNAQLKFDQVVICFENTYAPAPRLVKSIGCRKARRVQAFIHDNRTVGIKA